MASPKERNFSAYWNIRDEGAAALAGSPYVGRLNSLAVRGGGIGPPGQAGRGPLASTVGHCRRRRRIMRRVSPFVAVLGGALLALPCVADDKPLTVDVWPGKSPGEKGEIGKERAGEIKAGADFVIKSVTNVTQPTLTVYRPAKDKDTGAAVVIAPGGGYDILAWDLEGEEVAHWLNTIGVTGIILKYRVPRRSGTRFLQPPPQAEMDAQRAISLVRSKAGEWGIDPKRIGMLGFSAGGHLTAWTATNFDQRSYEAADDVDKVSCRPDFTVLVYPAWLVKGNELAPDIRVTKETPQAFFVHAADDLLVPAQGSVAMFSALRKAGVPAELHVYAAGGHGFGLRPSRGTAAATWPGLCADWMKARGLLTPAKASPQGKGARGPGSN
jgi:acetyl esterase/lipase